MTLPSHIFILIYLQNPDLNNNFYFFFYAVLCFIFHCPLLFYNLTTSVWFGLFNSMIMVNLLFRLCSDSDNFPCIWSDLFCSGYWDCRWVGLLLITIKCTIAWLIKYVPFFLPLGLLKSFYDGRNKLPHCPQDNDL